ncbi:DUF58 domain-containing protein [Bacterioplanes sanyensis]|uniref:DUF58 domain-containing protein n=1 Tax=Bacterioplanes sanyensis TaxID=1249553 RepID=A0A222FKX6_9GAMM|nr:DUF58 domain-containing protein [Bacterioplanes sanyensis]ASP39668.1 DUF58 domain-containing protein [Bacterioplanes sanyensis]
MSGWRGALRQRWQRWMERRIPAAQQLTLGHRSIFIFPSVIGWLFAALLLVMLLTAINYQNSLIYGLVFWLFSMGITAMHFSFGNLSGLTLTAGHALPVFAGETIELPVRLTSDKAKAHQSLLLRYPDGPEVVADVNADADDTVATLSIVTQRRGHLDAGRFLLESRYPLGLFRVWSWIRLRYPVVVYPQPVWIPFRFAQGSEGEWLEGATSDSSGEQDFHGLRSYQAGDSMRQIAWKQYARGRGLVSKDFDSDDGASCWFDWEALAPLPIEERLSHLTAWVLKAHQNGWQYGLRLPGHTLPQHHSELHLEACLQTLALFGQEPI